MNYIDLLRMSLSSLWRRKLRTVLTVLGVVVGTASIVVMISLGLGLNKTNMEQIEQYGGLTTISVYPNESGYVMYSSGGVMVESSSSSESNEPVRIDDAMIETIAQIEHVEIASPVLSLSAIAKQGVWEGDLYIRGMSQEALEKLNLEMAEGTLPTSDEELQLLFGNTVITNFYNAKTGQYPYWGELADVDFMNDPLFVIFDTEAYYNNKWGGTDENGTPVPAPKKYVVPSCGLIAGGPDEYGENSNYVLCNVDALKAQLTRAFKGKAIPGQPTNSAGKPYKEIYYNEAYIRVDDMDHVGEVQEQIRALGLQANSNVEWMNQVQEQSRSIQAALGGIGAVSLFVAAIGIANTMMMSIYERTKEIGVMKVLGCDLSAIRNMFLAEAGFIGLIGGVVGLILSYGISAIINFVLKESYYSNISYIPFYLSLVALIFAVLIGMLAGLFPALRAMRLSPLAAIRNE
ncbi:MAG TPA: ABC transporter permease [Candidatus Merdisoma merdipullorum]|nr:ABC transporter permease [Candidatus Merdisoma merdipullorum]